MTREQVIQTLVQDGFILVFNSTKLDVVKTAEALTVAGIRNMEVTCRIPNAAAELARLKRALPDFAAGAASLVDWPGYLEPFNAAHPKKALPTVKDMVEAGADFLVSAANFRPETYAAFKAKLPLIPGCGSVTEILQQAALGATICKLFPAAELGGPAFLKAVDPAIHRGISIMPTGGTNKKNIPDYIGAGVLVLGGSFSIIGNEALARIEADQDYTALAAAFREVKAMIDDLRRQQYAGVDLAKADLPAIRKATGRLLA